MRHKQSDVGVGDQVFRHTAQYPAAHRALRERARHQQVETPASLTHDFQSLRGDRSGFRQFDDRSVDAAPRQTFSQRARVRPFLVGRIGFQNDDLFGGDQERHRHRHGFARLFRTVPSDNDALSDRFNPPARRDQNGGSAFHQRGVQNVQRRFRRRRGQIWARQDGQIRHARTPRQDFVFGTENLAVARRDLFQSGLRLFNDRQAMIGGVFFKKRARPVRVFVVVFFFGANDVVHDKSRHVRADDGNGQNARGRRVNVNHVQMPVKPLGDQ